MTMKVTTSFVHAPICLWLVLQILKMRKKIFRDVNFFLSSLCVVGGAEDWLFFEIFQL